MRPTGTHTALLGELVYRPATWNPTREAVGKQIDYIDLSSVDNEAKSIISHQQIYSADAPSRARQLVRSGDILVSTVRPNLNGVARVPAELNEATASTGFCILRPDPKKLLAEYLFQWVRTRFFISDMVRKATGASYPAVSDRIILESTIPLPSLDEQRRIAAILDAADALRSKRREGLAKLNYLPQSIFTETFGNPEDYSKNYQPLGNYLTFVTSGGRGWAKFYAPDGCRFIRSLDVQMNRISNEDAVFVEPPDNAEAHRTRVSAGDVLLTITGSRIGRVAPVLDELESAYISQHVAILRLDRKPLLPVFLSFFLSLPSGGQRQIAKAQYGQTKPGLNFEKIKKFQIPVPPILEQERFCQRVAQVAQVENMFCASRDHLDALFASLQNRAFRGELTSERAATELKMAG